MTQTHDYGWPDFIRSFVCQLDQALARDVGALRKLDEKLMIPDALKKPLERLALASLDLIYDFNKRPDRVSAKDRANVKRLRQELDFFFPLLHKIAPTTKTRVAKTIGHFTDDLEHFIRNFNATLNSCKPGSKFPQRPKKTAERKVWLGIIKSHLSASGKFPRHTTVYPQMKKLGFTLSKETHGDWKKRYLTGTF
jgi:hypothetical protein